MHVKKSTACTHSWYVDPKRQRYTPAAQSSECLLMLKKTSSDQPRRSVYGRLERSRACACSNKTGVLQWQRWLLCLGLCEPGTEERWNQNLCNSLHFTLQLILQVILNLDELTIKPDQAAALCILLWHDSPQLALVTKVQRPLRTSSTLTASYGASLTCFRSCPRGNKTIQIHSISSIRLQRCSHANIRWQGTKTSHDFTKKHKECMQTFKWNSQASRSKHVLKIPQICLNPTWEHAPTHQISPANQNGFALPILFFCFVVRRSREFPNSFIMLYISLYCVLSFSASITHRIPSMIARTSCDKPTRSPWALRAWRARSESLEKCSRHVHNTPAQKCTESILSD